MTWFRANGAMVATYWSVLVTVRMAQTEITETGISSDARTTRTQAVIPRVRRARGFFFGPSRPARLARFGHGVPAGSPLGVHVGHLDTLTPPMPSAKGPWCARTARV